MNDQMFEIKEAMTEEVQALYEQYEQAQEEEGILHRRAARTNDMWDWFEADRAYDRLQAVAEQLTEAERILKSCEEIYERLGNYYSKYEVED